MLYDIQRFPVGHVNNYTYLIINTEGGTGILIDPAWEQKEILDHIKKAHIELKGILLTHSHQDHTNLADFFSKQYQCYVYMSKYEIEYYNFQCNNLVALEDNQKLRVSGIEIECLLTPGHTTGSMCYKIENALFTGDTIFIRSCGFCNCKGGNPQDMFLSIKKLRQYAEQGARIYPGHYFKNDFKYESDCLHRNIYFHIKDLEIFLKFVERSSKRNVYLKYEY